MDPLSYLALTEQQLSFIIARGGEPQEWKSHSLLGLIEDSDIIGGGRGHGDVGGGAVSGAVWSCPDCPDCPRHGGHVGDSCLARAACFRFTLARKPQHGCCRLTGTTFCSGCLFIGVLSLKGEWRLEWDLIHKHNLFTRAFLDVEAARPRLVVPSCVLQGAVQEQRLIHSPTPFSGIISSHGTWWRRRLSCCLWMSIAFLSNISKVLRV